MLDELHTASNLLHTALERYMNACSALRNGSSYNNNIHSAVEISNTVAAQVDLIESYKNKLIVAEVAVKRARNNLANVPINALPPETLAHIFHLLLAQQPCPLRTTTHWSSDNPVRPLKYPDVFTHVCSQWRQIALDSHELWSHIDIALSCPLSNMFHNRAETYVARAHQVPLDIHFIDPGYIRQTERSIALNNSSAHEYSAFDDESNDWADWINLDYDNNPEEFTFLSSSPQSLIRSLGLLVHHQYHPIHSRALGHCLVNCLPKGVSELVTNVPNDASSSPSFFQPSPGWQDQEFVSCDQLSLTEQQLGKVWYPIKTLVLNGRYPHWASTAYHGLTELHLLGGKSISILELANVLKSSPGLHTFHCDFIISDSSNSGTLVPIALQRLEKLDIRGMHKIGVAGFLRLLNPGPEPLRLSLCDDTPRAPLEDFFALSNVQELLVETRFRIYEEPELPPNTYCLPSGLRTLAVVQRGWSIFVFETEETFASFQPHNETPRSIELDTLYILSCRYDNFHQFREVLERYSPRKLVLWNCRVGQSSSDTIPIDLPFLGSEVGNNLPRLCPSIECLARHDPNPLQDWD